MGSYSFCIAVLVMFNLSFMDFSASLNPYFYAKVCPQALPTIKRVVGAAGCDASILLDSTSAFTSEKNAVPNANSARGFEVIDRIKYEVDKVCGCPAVSCADILAVAARDSVVALGGPSWEVQLGRRDSTTASESKANDDIPSPSMDLPELINSFKKQGLNMKDLVALSGGHTLGLSQCRLFKNRIYNESNIDPNFARQRRATCPPNGGDSNLAPLDPTPASFDTKYFSNLVSNKGLLHSDQALYNGGQTDYLVKTYSKNFVAFSKDFASSMIKMGNIKPLTGKRGQIRLDCKKVN
ncbi:cationic peroxidase 1-like [Olea europaea subsp. europaea]|uniref:Peroxidase n=1 Tax=Olea europaea subsp. europaea TaxID=158383 RepID=A0A8S0S3F5_OLEEU|nr:cationic peroxidase 1-like [Olea europaea subsp. europaea]